MSSLSLRLEGESPDVWLETFLSALTNWLKMLEELDCAISGQAQGSLHWVVSDLRTRGLVISAAASSKLPERDYGPDVVQAALSGMRLLEDEGLTPPYLSDVGLKSVQRLLKLIGHRGIMGLRMSNHRESVRLSLRAAANVDQLLPIRQSTLGSVKGQLAMIALHERSPRFFVYEGRTHKAVKCEFPAEMLDQVKGALGARVVATGVVQTNARHEPVRVELAQLRRLPAESELPSPAAIGGSDPDFTGAVSTVGYLRNMRGG